MKYTEVSGYSVAVGKNTATTKFATLSAISEYYDELPDDYAAHLKLQAEVESICKEYARFQNRVMRMLKPLVDNGEVDFSSAARKPRKYHVSQTSAELISMVLDYHSLVGEARIEMDTVLQQGTGFILCNGV